MLISPASAQKPSSDQPISISNISAEKVWQIAEMAINDNKIPVGKLDMEKGLLVSDWLEWNAIAIQNRGRLMLKYDSPNLVLNMADREYKSDKGWVEAIGSLSKKNYATYMQTVADRITEINKDEALTKQAVKTSKLIPAFISVNTFDDLVFTVLKTGRIDNLPELEFSVLNKGTQESMTELPVVALKISADAGGRSFGYAIWSRPGDIKSKAVIQPGETLTFKVKYEYNWDFSNIPRLDLKVISIRAGKKNIETLSIYQIPLTDYVYKPEKE
jgi:hypothetical protein